MKPVTASLIGIILLMACPLSAQIKCQLSGLNEVLLIGKDSRHKINIASLSSTEGKLYFHFDQESKNRFRVFLWKFKTFNTNIDDSNSYTGNSLEFDWVDAPGYGITEEGMRSISFYGRDRDTSNGRVFTIDQIRGFPKLSTPITLKPLQVITQP